jgi:hypothetical protein
MRVTVVLLYIGASVALLAPVYANATTIAMAITIRITITMTMSGAVE